MMDDLEHLSDEAKPAWQRGFDLAPPKEGARFAFADWFSEDARFAVAHPRSKEALYAEVEKLDSEECQEAMVMGFKRGLFAKTEAAKGEETEDDGPSG